MMLLACCITTAAAQEDLTRGKTPAQLFNSDCADCHRTPRGLAKTDARSLAAFLRVHYTASRESAAALAAYLTSLGAPARSNAPRPPRAAPSGAKPTTVQQGKPAVGEATKPGEAVPAKPGGPETNPTPAPAAAEPTSVPAANQQ